MFNNLHCGICVVFLLQRISLARTFQHGGSRLKRWVDHFSYPYMKNTNSLFPISEGPKFLFIAYWVSLSFFHAARFRFVAGAEVYLHPWLGCTKDVTLSRHLEFD